MIIRKALTEDADALLTFDGARFADGRPAYSLEKWQELIAADSIYVGLDRDGVTSFIMFEPMNTEFHKGDILINDIYVVPEKRGARLGHRDNYSAQLLESVLAVIDATERRAELSVVYTDHDTVMNMCHAFGGAVAARQEMDDIGLVTFTRKPFAHIIS